MAEHDWLAGIFETHRGHLRAVAYRMLGSANEADDAVQETWLRVSSTDVADVENLAGWLTTVVGRICLNMLRSRRTRREEPFEQDRPEPPAATADGPDPEGEAVLADTVGLALLVVLDTLTPAERLAFVLHDMFDVPFDEIAQIAGRSPAATRQLASRARRRVQGAAPTTGDDLSRRRTVVSAFLDAARSGDFESLLTLLDPAVVVRADQVAVKLGASERVDGARAAAETFSGRAQAARLALVDGVPALVWAKGDRPRVVFSFTIVDEKIVGIDLVGDPARLDQVSWTLLENR